MGDCVYQIHLGGWCQDDGVTSCIVNNGRRNGGRCRSSTILESTSQGLRFSFSSRITGFLKMRPDVPPVKHDVDGDGDHEEEGGPLMDIGQEVPEAHQDAASNLIPLGQDQPVHQAGDG